MQMFLSLLSHFTHSKSKYANIRANVHHTLTCVQAKEVSSLKAKHCYFPASIFACTVTTQYSQSIKSMQCTLQVFPFFVFTNPLNPTEIWYSSALFWLLEYWVNTLCYCFQSDCRFLAWHVPPLKLNSSLIPPQPVNTIVIFVDVGSSFTYYIRQGDFWSAIDCFWMKTKILLLLQNVFSICLQPLGVHLFSLISTMATKLLLTTFPSRMHFDEEGNCRLEDVCMRRAANHQQNKTCIGGGKMQLLRLGGSCFLQ